VRAAFALGNASVEVAAGATIDAGNARFAARLVDFIGALAFFLAGFFAAFFSAAFKAAFFLAGFRCADAFFFASFFFAATRQ
jgi:hypothetical protein